MIEGGKAGNSKHHSRWSSKGSNTDGKTYLANGSPSDNPEEMSVAEEGRETSSDFRDLRPEFELDWR